MSTADENRTLGEHEMGENGETIRGRCAPAPVSQPPGERSPYVEPAGPAETLVSPMAPDPVLDSVLAEDWGRVTADARKE